MSGAPRVVALAGLPGTGKSALAAALAALTGARVLDKDRFRAALFGSEDAASEAQNARAFAALLDEAARALGGAPVVVDGRTFSRRAHVDELAAWCDRHGARLDLVLCEAPREVALLRLASDAAAGRHPAPDRGPGRFAELHARVAARFEPLERPHLVVDTATAPPDALAALVARALGLNCAAPRGTAP